MILRERKRKIDMNATQNEKHQKAVERAELLALICCVREGEQEAFALLLDQYRPLIESQVSRFSADAMGEADREDLRQEATMSFYHAILAYDVEQTEVEFGLYAKICISNALISQLRIQKRRTAEQLTESLSTHMIVHDSEDPAGRILEQERVKALYSVIRKNLSDLEYRVWQCYMSGLTAREIGRLVGKDEKSVSNAIYRIRKKLRALLG